MGIKNNLDKFMGLSTLLYTFKLHLLNKKKIWKDV